MNNKLKIWELSLLFALCFTMVFGMFARAQQKKLAGEVIRLHVVANSDDNEDQRLKLLVRDATAEYLEPYLNNTSSSTGAEKIISSKLPELKRVAETTLLRNGCKDTVHTVLANEYFPTRDYGELALPAGEYLSLRIIIGEGIGHNWWCVVFPPLCLNAVSRSESLENLSPDSAKLIMEDTGETKLKFRILELLEILRKNLS